MVRLPHGTFTPGFTSNSKFLVYSFFYTRPYITRDPVTLYIDSKLNREGGPEHPEGPQHKSPKLELTSINLRHVRNDN